MKDKAMTITFNKRKFIRLTDRTTETGVFVDIDTIKIIAPLTEELLHENDYNFSKDNDYDKETIFGGVKTTEGIFHTKETPEEIMDLLLGWRR